MKQVLFVMFVAGVLFSGCALDINGASEQSQTVAAASDSAIKVQIGDGGFGNAIIDLNEYQVTNAIFTLTDPEGNSIVNTWTPGGSTYFTFTGMKAGTHTLTILETDTFPKEFTASAVINVRKGYNYTINVVLGGNITMTSEVAQ